MSVTNDTIDLREIARALRRGWLWIAGGALGGLLVAAVATLLLRPQYEGVATVLLRSGSEGAGSLMGASSGSSDGRGISLGGLANILSMGSGFETEAEILTSRSVTGAVVDSLGLQAVVIEPEAIGPANLFSAARWDPELLGGIYQFERDGKEYQVHGPGAADRVVPGIPFRLNGSWITLRTDRLPDEFEIELSDRESAIAAFRKRLDFDQAGGDVAELAYRAPDPQTAAAAPNAVVAQYLARRRTTDRGANQQRYEFLAAHTDSIRTELARAEQALRQQQEQSGFLDPEVFSEAEIGQGLQLRAELDQADVEARAFQEVLNQATAGVLKPQSLAAYPTFLGNPATNNLLSRLQTLEGQRTDLLDRRTEADPDVLILNKQIRQTEDQLVSLSSAYLNGLNQKRAEIGHELGRYDAVLDQLPAQAQAYYQSEREVKRLSETLIALQTQLVQARLAAIAEGGGVRQVDVAVIPRQPVFPRPFLNLGVGLLGGLILGAVGAIGSQSLSNRVRDTNDAELAAGVPAVALGSRTPLLLGAAGAWRSVLLVPVGPNVLATAAARRVAGAAAMQGRSVVLVDLQEAPFAASPRANGSGAKGQPDEHTELVPTDSLQPEEAGDGGAYLVYRGAAPGETRPHARTALEELERRFSAVVVALPALDRFPTPALLSPERPVILVALAGVTTRTELQETVTMLERLGIRVPGVVVGERVDDAQRSVS